MKAIEIKARQHYKNVKAGEFKPTFSPGLAPSESDLVWVGNVPLPLEDYYNFLAARDRAEARLLVRSPKREGSASKRGETTKNESGLQEKTKGQT